MTDRPIKNKYIMISEKLSKAAKSVIPIVAVVLVLSLTIAPIPTDLMLSFLLGTLSLVLGMDLFFSPFRNVNAAHRQKKRPYAYRHETPSAATACRGRKRGQN